MNSIAFTIGSWPVYWYGVLISSALIIGIFLSQRLAKVRGYDLDQIWTIFLILIPCAVIGARLYYVVFNWDIYAGDPLKICQIWKGGLAVHGGIIGGVLAVFFCCKKYRLDFWGVLDCIAPSMALGQAIGRWGNYFNGEAYGRVTDLPWGIHVPDDPFLHHPTFFYESVCDFLLFLILMKMFKKSRRTGNVTCVYFIVYSFYRFFIEGLRTDSLMIGPLRQAQVLSLCLLILAVLLLLWRNRLHPAAEIGPRPSQQKVVAESNDSGQPKEKTGRKGQTSKSPKKKRKKK